MNSPVSASVNMDDIAAIIGLYHTKAITSRLAITLLDNGYRGVRVAGGEVCGLLRMMFTTRVCVGINQSGYQRHYCFETWPDAERYLSESDGTPPVVGVDGCTAVKGDKP